MTWGPQRGRGAPGKRRGLGLARVSGVSMLPTLAPGDLLLVRWGGRPRPGQLALVELPDGRPLAVKRLTRPVPGGWWVERDNPRAGVDSWLVGALPATAVRAVVLCRLPRLRRRGCGPRGAPGSGA